VEVVGLGLRPVTVTALPGHVWFSGSETELHRLAWVSGGLGVSGVSAGQVSLWS
jgi:hypothetical protein